MLRTFYLSSLYFPQTFNHIFGARVERNNRLFHIVVLFLFLYAYQTSAIHSLHIFSQEINQCDACTFSKHNPIEVSRNHSIGISEIMVYNNEILPLEVHDKKSKPLPLHIVSPKVIFEGLHPLHKLPLITGFNATAPPRV
jgi:hypothetical protein